MSLKTLMSHIIPKSVWKEIRLRGILRSHKRTATKCERLIEGYKRRGTSFLSEIKALKVFGTDKIIWQYWAQGYDNLPELVSICLRSVDKWSSGCRVIRLDDSNISEYMELPEYVKNVALKFGRAFYSDLLRTILLSLYGGVWLDATVLLTGPLPDRYFDKEVFLFQRDNEEKHKDYWENSYAYYFGWSKGFRVNMLSSVLFSQKESPFMEILCELMLLFSKTETKLPDYFMFQVLFDVLSKGEMAAHNCEVESDCVPHYLMQICNDNFPFATLEEVLSLTNIHKLSYKNIDVLKLKQCLSNH